VGESGMIRTQMGAHSRSEMVSVWDALCDATCISNSEVRQHRISYYSFSTVNPERNFFCIHSFQFMQSMS
jgi:hypothetical protein